MIFILSVLLCIETTRSCFQDTGQCTFIANRTSADKKTFEIPGGIPNNSIITVKGEFVPNSPKKGWLLKLTNDTSTTPIMRFYRRNKTDLSWYTPESGRVINAFSNSSDLFTLQIMQTDSAQQFLFTPLAEKVYTKKAEDPGLETATTVVLFNNARNIVTFEYMSVCKSAELAACSVENELPARLELGSSYTLSCKVSGAPFLGVQWLKNGTTISNIYTIETSIDTSNATNILQSTLNIASFQIADAGDFTCMATNKRFNTSLNKTFTLAFASIPVVTDPEFAIFTILPAVFRWEAQGWPLADFNLHCSPNQDQDDITIESTNNAIIDGELPIKTFTLTLSLGFSGHYITCVLIEGTSFENSPYHSVTINKRCIPGEFVDKDDQNACKPCPSGQHSDATSDYACYASNCPANHYGRGDNCTTCPFGMISNAGATMLHDCVDAGSTCNIGSYATTGGCIPCSLGRTSKAEAAKERDCEVVPNANCEVNYYGSDGKCSLCPSGQTSPRAGAVKLADCHEADSECRAGSFGTGSSCTKCPDNMTSIASSAKIEECFCKASYYPRRYPDPCVLCQAGSTSEVNAEGNSGCRRVASSCSAGEFGVQDNCEACPIGKDSVEKTVKIEDCSSVTRADCPKNHFGYNGDCQVCPQGLVSELGTVKVQDCTNGFGDCPAGKYGQASDQCLECPEHATSGCQSAKIEDCFCKAGFFGVLHNCSECPQGFSSATGTKYVRDCFEEETAGDLAIGDPERSASTKPLALVGSAVGGAAGLLIIIVIGFVIVKKKRSKPKPSEEIEPISQSRLNSLMISAPIIHYHPGSDNQSELTYSTVMKVRRESTKKDDQHRPDQHVNKPLPPSATNDPESLYAQVEFHPDKDKISAARRKVVPRAISEDTQYLTITETVRLGETETEPVYSEVSKQH